MTLIQAEQQRYTRQMMLPGWGEAGQEKLKNSRVFVAGAGGLGSPLLMYLAAAGVGNITVCDFDSPEMSNLNRQILHDESRIGINKATSAQTTLLNLNPYIQVTPITDKITADNVDAMVGDAQIIVDCMDNFDTRFALNRAALTKGIPFVHGSIWGLEGRLTFIQAPETPCLQCLYSEGPVKEVFPVLGATPGVIGTLQAVETIKYLIGIGEPLKHKLLVWDGNRMDFRTFKIRRDPACPTCGGH